MKCVSVSGRMTDGKMIYLTLMYQIFNRSCCYLEFYLDSIILFLKIVRHYVDSVSVKPIEVIMDFCAIIS